MLWVRNHEPEVYGQVHKFLQAKDFVVARLTSHLRDYNPVEPYRTTLDLEAQPAEYAANFKDIKGQIST